MTAQALALFGFGLYQGLRVVHIGLEIVGLLGFVVLASLPFFGRRLQSVFSSAGLITCSALLTHLSGGYIEAHFHFFVMLGVIVLYEDWIPFSLSIAYVAIHHGVVGMVDPGSVYNHPAAFANPWLWASIHAFFILWLSTALIIYWRISERLRAKTDLVLRSSPTGIVGVDDGGRITFANNAAAKLAGTEVDDLVGRSYQDLVMVSDGGHASNGSPAQATLKSRGGTLIPVELSASSVGAPSQGVGRVLSFTDIRERLAAQRELQISEERFRSLSACSPVGIFVSDTQGLATYLNPRCQEICGFQEEEGRGRGWVAFVHPLDRDMVVDKWSAYAASIHQRETPSSFNEEFRFVNPKRGTCWVNARAAPLFNDQGKVIGHVGTVEDITQRHEASERLKQFNQELEERVRVRTHDLQTAMEELESFNYSVSHDLRSPLRVITGFSELMLDAAQKKLSPEDLQSLREIHDASIRMNRTVEALLHLSTINRTKVTRQRVDLSQLAHVLVEALRVGTPDRQVDVQIQTGLVEDADPELAAVVLQNLLGNAWKFSGERERAAIAFGALETGAGKVYYVRDNGVGFDPKQSSTLFRAFHRLHEASRFEGTGIGLATVGRIIQRHGGTVRAVGAVGEGALFLFTFAPVPIPKNIQHPADILSPSRFAAPVPSKPSGRLGG